MLRKYRRFTETDPLNNGSSAALKDPSENTPEEIEDVDSRIEKLYNTKSVFDIEGDLWGDSKDPTAR